MSNQRNRIAGKPGEKPISSFPYNYIWYASVLFVPCHAVPCHCHPIDLNTFFLLFGPLLFLSLALFVFISYLVLLLSEPFSTKTFFDLFLLVLFFHSIVCKLSSVKLFKFIWLASLYLWPCCTTYNCSIICLEVEFLLFLLSPSTFSLLFSNNGLPLYLSVLSTYLSLSSLGSFSTSLYSFSISCSSLYPTISAPW